MTDEEIYEFDRCGYLVIPKLIHKRTASRLLSASEALERHASDNLSRQEVVERRGDGLEIRHDQELGYHQMAIRDGGGITVLQDFWNSCSEFDCLINHVRTMSYINNVIMARPNIVSSEILLRRTGHATPTHMGGPVEQKFRYNVTSGKIDCGMVRMIYFLHDVDLSEGAFSVVPGSHKSSFVPPYQVPAEEEPGMIGLNVKAGDGILFTENLRHGSLRNISAKTRKTIHVGYGPYWLRSQSVFGIDEPQVLTQATRNRLLPKQNALFVPHVR